MHYSNKPFQSCGLYISYKSMPLIELYTDEYILLKLTLVVFQLIQFHNNQEIPSDFMFSLVSFYGFHIKYRL